MLALRAGWTTGSHSLTSSDRVVPGDARPCRRPNSSDPEDVFIDTVWWVNQEVLHHGAEIALLRDLYRAK